MNELYFNKPDRLMTYPSQRVCAIIDERDNASCALDALIKSGTREEDIEILYGKEGIDLLNPGASGHGFFSKIADKFQSFGELGRKLINSYESALRQGGYVFVIPSYSDADKGHIRSSLESGNAREINFFTSWYVEAM
ncbi:MAG: hypothetical protein Q8916_05570 [Bacteroidota bacterium]|nr:hypothetical protein [Bacteroidota bacterium]MDP4229859.1 hypothetical protein [Bacteroidota bacterium]MDP4234966.1 hypothetical protein [Bacteroidota bacterium]